jgi:hypothetical protein
MLTRRGFIGSVLLTAPVTTVIVNSDWHTPVERPHIEKVATEVELRTDADDRYIEPHRFGLLAFIMLDRKLRDTPGKVVGPPDLYRGDTWGSGQFTHDVYAFLDDLDVREGKLRRDRVLLDDITSQMAERIAWLNLRSFGRRELPHGTMSAHRYQSPRLAMRFLTQYDVVRNGVLGRFDVLGGPA